jgi:hypothetical protein
LSSTVVDVDGWGSIVRARARMPDVFSLITQLEDRAKGLAHLHGIRLVAAVWLVFMLSWIFGTPEDEEF